MALRKLAETLVRIGGIFLALNMTSLSGVLMSFSQGGNMRSFMVGGVFMIIALPGLIMIFAPRKIVGAIMPASKKPTEEYQDSYDEDLTLLYEMIEPMLVSLAGLYFFVTGGINGLSYGLSWGISQFSELSYYVMPSMVLVAIFQFIAGFYLLFGAQGLRKTLRWIRTIYPDVHR